MRKVSGIRGPRAPRVAMADPAMAASPDMSGMGMPPGMKHGGKVHKYAKGGVILGEHHGSMGLKKGHKGHGEHPIQVKGHTKGKVC